MLHARGLIDLLVPRGGNELIERVVRESVVPVIETGVGNCHVYVDAAADLDMAVSILVNAKVQRPSVCNAAESSWSTGRWWRRSLPGPCGRWRTRE